MKNLIIIITTAFALTFAACKKDESPMSTSNFNVDTQKYSVALNQDLANANQYETALRGSGASDSAYNAMMYDKNDSLFSTHFYQFCVNMMKNSGMMGNSSGKMMNGNNGNMMGGSSSMMNGNSMGGSMDLYKMTNYMDSIHINMLNILGADYQMHDSLLHNQMTLCKMMSSQTSRIEQSYSNMQLLRRNHKLFHRN